MTNPNTLIIADTHFPFGKAGYLDFCNDMSKKHRCKRICHVGDVVDGHAISFHTHDPDGMSAGDELRAVKKELKAWYKCFPKVDCAIGNHDELIRRQAYGVGLPSAYLRSFRDVLGAPAGWRFEFNFKYKNWQLVHGTNTSGTMAAYKTAMSARISTASGHLHGKASVMFHASNHDMIWAMQVGSGINRRAYAFNYGRDFQDKPIVSVGVVIENGRVPFVEPMPL